MLIKLRGEGYSASRIALEIGGGVTRNAVLGKAFRLRLPLLRASHVVTRRRRRKVIPLSQMKRRKIRKPMPPRALPPGVEPVPVLPPPESKQVTIYQLTDHICKYPYGDAVPYTYCGHDAKENSPYCEYHSGLCFNDPPPRRSRSTWAPR